MDAKNGLVPFGLLLVLFGFTFIFCMDALALPNVFYGGLALGGYIVCVAASLFLGMMAHREGEALSLYFYIYGVIVAIIFIWYLTRCGTAFGWW
jgi:hypothetical protein